MMKKMHLTQWCSENSASNFHVKLPNYQYQENLFQCKSFNQKCFVEKVTNSESGIMKTPEKFQRNPKDICKLQRHTVQT